MHDDFATVAQVVVPQLVAPVEELQRAFVHDAHLFRWSLRLDLVVDVALPATQRVLVPDDVLLVWDVFWLLKQFVNAC